MISKSRKMPQRGNRRMPPSFAFYLVQSGYQVFKKRLREELLTSRGVELDDNVEDDTLYRLYQQGESVTYVMARLCGQYCD